MQALQTLEIGPPGRVDLSIIWLHGLGADGHDFAPIVDELGLTAPVRFVFPHAPLRSVTINAGMRMRAWYDIESVDAGMREDEAGIRESAAMIRGLIDSESARGVASKRIVLAGFSQGGAIALHTALREPRPLAGVLALSTYLPLAATLAGERDPANDAVSIWMAHGSADPMIHLSLAERSRAALESAGYAVEWHCYPMAHAVCGDEIRDIGVWLNRRIEVSAQAPGG
jgi:phospholipase/carboxylesterase